MSNREPISSLILRFRANEVDSEPSVAARKLQDQVFQAIAANMAPALAVFDDSSAENRITGALGQTTSGKRLKIRTYPKFNSLEDERQYRKQHLAAAFRLFADRGFDEGVAGHISVRDPILTDHFCVCIPSFLSPAARMGHPVDE